MLSVQSVKFKLDALNDYNRDDFYVKVESDLEDFEKQCDLKSDW